MKRSQSRTGGPLSSVRFLGDPWRLGEGCALRRRLGLDCRGAGGAEPAAAEACRVIGAARVVEGTAFAWLGDGARAAA